MPSSTPLYRAQALVQFASTLLQRAGMGTSQADCVANTLVEGDLLGHDTHGLQLLAGYVKELETGSMKGQGAPLVVSDRPAALLWDGQRLPGPWLVLQAIELALQFQTPHWKMQRVVLIDKNVSNRKTE